MPTTGSIKEEQKEEEPTKKVEEECRGPINKEEELKNVFKQRENGI